MVTSADTVASVGDKGSGFLQSVYLKWCLARRRIQEHNQAIKELEHEADGYERAIVDYAETQGLESWRVGGKGPSGRIAYKHQVWVIKEKRDAALQWLEEHGYGNVITPNYSSLNALFKGLIEGAAERGEVFEIPECFKHEVRADIHPNYNGWSAEKIEAAIQGGSDEQ